MRVIASIVGLVVGGVILSTTGQPVHAQETIQPRTETKKAVVVKVKQGDSLSKIAKKHDTTYQRLFYANKKIAHPDVTHPGQKLRVPEKDEKLRKRNIPGVVATAPKASRKYSAPKVHISTAGDNVSGGVWDRLAACESGGNWHINTGNGYYGGLQFSLSSWRGVGGSGYPHQASKAEQIKRGQMLKASGGWGHWPACSAKLGLR